MDLRKVGRPSNRVIDGRSEAKVNPDGKGNKYGKSDYIFYSPELKAALTDISTSFQDKVNGRVGKSDRQNSPNSPANKYIAENWMNRSKDKLTTVRPQPKPKAR